MRWKTPVALVAIWAFVAMQDLCVAEVDVQPQDAKLFINPHQQDDAEMRYHDDDGYYHGQRGYDYDHGPKGYYPEREPTYYSKHAHKGKPGPPGPPGPPGETNCTQLTELPDAGGCGLIPYDVFQPFTTEFILQFINLQNQLQALQQSYNSLAMAVSAVEERVALAGLPSGPTNTTQTNLTNPLCGPPRTISRNAFGLGYLVQDPANNITRCSNSSLAAFSQSLIQQVNIKDPCAESNNKTRVNVRVSCTELGVKASYAATVEIYSNYPCSYVPWFRAVTKNGDTYSSCSRDDPSCNCAGIAEPVCQAIRSGYGNVLIVNDGDPLVIRLSNCGVCLDRGDLFCSPDGYSPACPISGCAGP